MTLLEAHQQKLGEDTLKPTVGSQPASMANYPSRGLQFSCLPVTSQRLRVQPAIADKLFMHELSIWLTG